MRTAADVALRLHKITPDGIRLIGERTYCPGTLVSVVKNRGRAALALELLDEARARRAGALIVAGPSYGGSGWFIEELNNRGFDWVVELPRKASVSIRGSSAAVPAIELLASAPWKAQPLVSPATGQRINYAIANLGRVRIPCQGTRRLFAAQSGAIQGLHNGTIIGLSSVGAVDVGITCLIGDVRGGTRADFQGVFVMEFAAPLGQERIGGKRLVWRRFPLSPFI